MTASAEPWFHDREIDGAVTHALVIGCSDYPHADAWGRDAVGPADRAASSALMVARRLRSLPLARPLASIELVLSPTASEAEEPQFDDVAVPRATSTEISEALERWRSRNRNNRHGVAFLYVVGHGVIYGTRDHSILLEDLGRAQPIMRGSLDVGSVHAGMAGPNLPQTQFYFVDACRVRSAFLEKFDEAGQGCGFTRMRGIEDDRSAPIFASAVPGSLAWADRSAGSLFAHALLEVLESGEAVDDDLWGVEDDGPSFFPVTAASLGRPLQIAVRRLADDHGRKQVVTVDGLQHGDAVLLRHTEPPRVPVAITLRPRPIAARCAVDVRKVDSPDVLATVTFDGSGRAAADVPLGWSSLDLAVPSDLAPHRGWQDERRVAMPATGGRSWPLAAHSEPA